jgi:hypothetical protein
MSVKRTLSEEQMKDNWKQPRCGHFGIYQVILCGTRKGAINKVITGNEEVEHTDTRMVDSLAGTATEDATSKRSIATFFNIML